LHFSDFVRGDSISQKTWYFHIPMSSKAEFGILERMNRALWKKTLPQIQCYYVD